LPKVSPNAHPSSSVGLTISSIPFVRGRYSVGSKPDSSGSQSALARCSSQEGSLTEAAEEKAEEQRREAEKQSKLAAERKAQVASFLRDNGFKDATTSKRKLLKTTYPLHCAAELGDPQIVGMLIEAGANPRQTNSSGKTPAQVAEKRNRNGSHNDVLRALGGA